MKTNTGALRAQQALLQELVTTMSGETTLEQALADINSRFPAKLSLILKVEDGVAKLTVTNTGGKMKRTAIALLQDADSEQKIAIPALNAGESREYIAGTLFGEVTLRRKIGGKVQAKVVSDDRYNLAVTPVWSDDGSVLRLNMVNVGGVMRGLSMVGVFNGEQLVYDGTMKLAQDETSNISLAAELFPAGVTQLRFVTAKQEMVLDIPARPTPPMLWVVSSPEWVDGSLQISITNNGGKMVKAVSVYVDTTPYTSAAVAFEAGQTYTLPLNNPVVGQTNRIWIDGHRMLDFVVPSPEQARETVETTATTLDEALKDPNFQTTARWEGRDKLVITLTNTGGAMVAPEVCHIYQGGATTLVNQTVNLGAGESVEFEVAGDSIQAMVTVLKLYVAHLYPADDMTIPLRPEQVSAVPVAATKPKFEFGEPQWKDGKLVIVVTNVGGSMTNQTYFMVEGQVTRNEGDYLTLAAGESATLKGGKPITEEAMKVWIGGEVAHSFLVPEPAGEVVTEAE
ncbi:hypothetical protein H3C66_04145 [Patescibacteria group bacterium]|nr:hypothetical protein [Patescibacteria group bacterium]